jgi:putative ABC transport system permease protein
MGPNLAADIHDEMELHVSLITDRHVAAGMNPDAAREQALKDFGDMAAAKETMMQIDASHQRSSRRAEVLNNLARDIRHGARRLAKNPGITAVTVLTLAIGLGPNIAIFNIINSVLLRPLPYRNPDELVVLNESFPIPGGTEQDGAVSGANFADWRAQNRTFSAMALSGGSASANLGDVATPERLSAASVDAAAFPMLGVTPLRGRLFHQEETAAGGPLVVLLGEGFWRRKYLGDESIVGRRISIDGMAREVIGILPSKITFPNSSSPPDLWLPMLPELSPAHRAEHSYLAFGRLRPGVTQAQAVADMRLVAARLAQEYPQDQEGRGVVIAALTDGVVATARTQLMIFLGAAALVLLIACANAASLLLARAASRGREVAVLAALGATRARIIQQFLIESLLISALASAVAVVLAVAAVKGIVISAGNLMPRTTEIHFDARVALFVVGAILLTTLVCGLAPALRATRINLQSSLRQGGRGASSAGLRRGLVVGQFALSLILLAGAGLLLRTFAKLMDVDTGIKTDRVITMHLPFPIGGPRYPTGAVAVGRFHKPLLDQLRSTPGVDAAGMISMIPLQEYGANGTFTIVGKAYATVAMQPFAEVRCVSPGYFSVLGIPLLAGRDIRDDDGPETRQVALVNEALARRYFNDESPLGRQIAFGPVTSQNPAMTIVGVVGSVKQIGLDREISPEVYMSYVQRPFPLRDMGLLIRTRSDPAALLNTVTRAVKSLDPNQPIYRVKTMREIASDSVSSRRLYMRLLAAFAAVALLLAMAGIYGVISFAVTQRTREFGIRVALGSDSGRIGRMVVWDAAKLTLLGLAIGLPGAFVLTRLISGLLYGVGRSDPTTYAVVAGLLATVSLAASYLPARRAVRVDPVLAMRTE